MNMINNQDLIKLAVNPFCIINKGEKVSVYKGWLKCYDKITDLPELVSEGVNYISLLPYNQMKERNFEVNDEGEKILTIHVKEKSEMSVDMFAKALKEIEIDLKGEITSNITDEKYKEIIGKVINDEIRNGEGSNFLLSRKYFIEINEFKIEHVFSIFKKLIENEIGSYWNFIFYTGKAIFIGASPERHLTIENSVTYMNPICGTLPKLGKGNFGKKLEEFICDPKEINELFQVVDEELKIVCKICPLQGKIHGPLLKEMSTLIHSEYILEGLQDKEHSNIFQSLKESLYAATMVGSPLENAARIIKKYEPESRRYYSSAICTFGKDESGNDFLDSAITIRTMEIQQDGRCVIQAGASIVRDSVPELECRETQTKAQGMINAILNGQKREVILPQYLNDDFMEKFRSRNLSLSKFWVDATEKYGLPKKKSKIQLIDNEDDFIYMIKHMLDYLGYKTNVTRYSDYSYSAEYDAVVIGPGPGDPNNMNHEKMRILYGIVDELFKNNKKILGVCLGHQILSKSLGLELSKSIIPFQGMQKEIDLFGTKQKVGFYNSYFAIDNDVITDVCISKNGEGKIFALKGSNYISFQFHVESILTQNGLEILEEAMNYLITRQCVEVEAAV